MRVDVTMDGPIVPAGELGPLLGLPPAEVPRLMRQGAITARHEKGVDKDAGRFRLIFRYGDRMVRLTCTDDGTFIGQVRISGLQGHG